MPLSFLEPALRSAWHEVTSGQKAENKRNWPEELRYCVARLKSRRADPESGLDGIERHVLRFVPADWVISARVVGDAMAHAEPFDHIGDLSLFWAIKTLATQHKRVELRGDPRNMRACELRLSGS